MAPTSPRRGGRSTVALLLISGLVCALTALAGTATASQPSHPRHHARPAARHLSVTRLAGWSFRPFSLTTGTHRSFTVRLLSAGGSARRQVVLERRVVGGHGWHPASRAITDRSGRAHLTWVAPASPALVWLRVRVPRSRRALGLSSPLRLATVLAGPAGSPSDPGTSNPGTATDARVQQVLDLVNQARATARSCGSEHFGSAPALHLDSRLEQSADRYAHRMATENFFSHTSPDGDDPGDRITAAGYRWHAWGENIAAGQTTAADVVSAWLASPDHCSNLMDPGFVDVGIGVATDPTSTYGTYWVQDFGHP